MSGISDAARQPAHEGNHNTKLVRGLLLVWAPFWSSLQLGSLGGSTFTQMALLDEQ